MAAAKIAAVDFINMTSLDATGLLAAMFVGEDLLASQSLENI